MRRDIIVGAVIVAAAIVFAGLCQRYELHGQGGGARSFVLRLDRLTGKTQSCMIIPEDIAKDYKAGWCGTLAPPEPMN